MKIVNRQPAETADASSNRGEMWKELRHLVVYAALLVVFVFFAVGWVVDLIVPSISAEREAALFSKWNPIRKTTPEDEAKLQPAREILDRLIQDPAVPKLPYRLSLIHNPTPNAFAFPGGTIGLTSGLLDALESKAALTFVLGHELGHFHQRDHLRGFGRSLGGGIAFAILFGGEMGNRQFANTFTHILSRSYSRDQEEGADLFGLGLAFRTYGETEGCDQLFRVLQESDETPEWAYMLSTHPAPAQRIEQLRKEAERLKRQESPSLRVERDPATQQVVVYEGTRPVLQYNDQLVSAPEGFATNEEARKYAVARSNYIHPLYGLDGQVLTHDFSEDHPHHRGIYWAWPEVAWQGKQGDLHALQIVFSRLKEPATWNVTPDYAEVAGKVRWLWEDKTPIVRETVAIRVWPSGGHGQVIDTTFTFEAIDQPVTLGRRGLTAYGGLNIRLAPIGQLKLQPHADGSNPAWSDCSGIWKGNDQPAGLTVFESRQNPGYPGDYIEYPTLPWFQPTFPRSGTFHTLEKGKPLTLQYRFWIRRGGPVAEEGATQMWHQYQKTLQSHLENNGVHP